MWDEIDAMVQREKERLDCIVITGDTEVDWRDTKIKDDDEEEDEEDT